MELGILVLDATQPQRGAVPRGQTAERSSRSKSASALVTFSLEDGYLEALCAEVRSWAELPSLWPSGTPEEFRDDLLFTCTRFPAYRLSWTGTPGWDSEVLAAALVVERDGRLDLRVSRVATTVRHIVMWCLEPTNASRVQTYALQALSHRVYAARACKQAYLRHAVPYLAAQDLSVRAIKRRLLDAGVTTSVGTVGRVLRDSGVRSQLCPPAWTAAEQSRLRSAMAKRRDGRSAAEVIRQVAGEIGRSVVAVKKFWQRTRNHSHHPLGDL